MLKSPKFQTKLLGAQAFGSDHLLVATNHQHLQSIMWVLASAEI